MVSQFAVGQRATVMRADIIEGIKFAVGVKQRHHVTVDFNERLAGIGDLGGRGDTNEFLHGRREKGAQETRRIRLPTACASASRTGGIVMRSKICWKKPATTSRAASSAVSPRDWA
jgi:hypothetical protein